MSSSGDNPSLAHPRYWPTWAGIYLLRILILMPWRIQILLGRGAGWLAFRFLEGRRKVTETNIRLCLPELSEKEAKTLASAHYQAMGVGIFETCMAWWAPSSRLPKYEIIGREHIEKAKAAGKGIILFTAHFTTVEISGRMFCDNIPLGCFYRAPDNPVVAAQLHAERIRQMSVVVLLDDLRGLLRALKKNHILWYAPDQGKRVKQSSILPFFGVPAITNTATSRLAEMTGAAVVPFFAERKRDGSYILNILPRLENFPTADADADAIRTNLMIEKQVRNVPEQYFWSHRRFKRRGKGYPKVY